MWWLSVFVGASTRASLVSTLCLGYGYGVGFECFFVLCVVIFRWFVCAPMVYLICSCGKLFNC